MAVIFEVFMPELFAVQLHLLSDVKKKARDGAERLRACLDGYFFELRR